MDNNFSTVDTSTVDASNNWKIAINESLNHLKKLVKMDKLRPKLSILTPDDKEKLDNKETSNDNKIEYLVKVLPQRANHWWDHLLSSLKDADDNLLKLAARIIEIKKYSIDQSDVFYEQPETYNDPLLIFAGHIRQQETLLEKTKQKQITLIKCTKGVINSGESLAEAITSYYNTSVTYPYHGLSLSANKNTIDAQQLTKFQEEWEKHITDESLLSELEEALEKENYNAMTKLQLQYTRASDTDGEDTDGLVSVELLIQKVESTYSEIFLPEDTLEKNPEELKPIIESTVNFAVALNSFHEAIRSTHDEGFDLTNVILISLKHPAIIKATDLWGEAYVKLIEATEDLY